MIKIECKKAVCNRMFLASCLVSLFFVIVAALYNVSYYMAMSQNVVSGNAMKQSVTLYNSWIGHDGMSLGSVCFYYLFALLATLPYGWAYQVEHKIGYDKNMIIRAGKFEYFFSKYIAVFLAGGLTILVTLVSNFYITSLFIPAIQPDIHYEIYYGVSYGTMWSYFFFDMPILYVILYMILNFIFAGLFACFSLTCSMFLKNRITILVIPYLVFLLLHYLRNFCHYKFYEEISPLNYLQAICLENNTCWWIVLSQGLIFFCVSFGVVMLYGRKRELL